MEEFRNEIASTQILIVEDSATQAAQLEHHLSTRGYPVMVARNGREALAEAITRKPSIIVTDVVMPEMDGFQLCKEVKSRAELKEVPVILLTSLSGPRDVLKGLECGADNFIRKPYDPRYLLTRIEYILMNVALRKSNRLEMGIQLYFGGERYFITAEKQQILDLLISTYEGALQINRELADNQQELARERDLLHTLMDNVPDFIYFKDVEGRYSRINRAQAVAFGIYHTSDAIGKTDFDFCEKEIAEESLADEQRIMKTGVPIIGKVEMARRTDGSSQWVSTTKMLIRDLNGSTVGTFGVSRDITQSKLAEETIRKAKVELEERVAERTAELAEANRQLQRELVERKRAQKMEQEAHARFRFLFASNPLPMWVYNPATLRILEINDAAQKEYGFSAAEFLAMQTTELEAEGAAATTRSGERKHKVKTGKTIEVEVIEHPIAWGDRPATLVVARNVTDQKRLQREFLQAQKMEAVGRLAAGVAHDFNNLLTVVNGYSGTILDELPKEDPLYDDVTQILRAGERAAGLTRQLLSFSRKSISEAVVLDLNSVVADMDRMLQRVIGEDIELVTVLAPGLGCIKADPGQMEQVIMNLAVNARDAMPKGGKLTIETGNIHFEENLAGRHPTLLKAGSYVMLAVSDTGTGMSQETQTRIFEPFYTTKEPGKGTGLGLSTVYAIVEQTGGTILVYSEEGRGTTFKIYLPYTVNASGLGGQGLAPAMPLGGETVLVVEDELIVRRLTCRLLELLGYSVLQAEDGPQAIALSESYESQIDLLVSDLVMPSMNGRELADHLRAQRPNLRVLFMSGYADNGIIQMGMLPANSAFLAKPFAKQSLAHKVRQVLDEASTK